MGTESAIRNLRKHLAINAELRRAEVVPPHSLTVFDSTGLAPANTTAAVCEQVDQRLA